MSVEAVWRALPELEWVTTESIRQASGVNEERLILILNFLVRWKFVETRTHPKFGFRRNPGATSPVDVASILPTSDNAEQGHETSIAMSHGASLAERVACRACGRRHFNFIKQNLVECTRCHERQWYTITGTSGRIREKITVADRVGWLRRLRRR